MKKTILGIVIALLVFAAAGAAYWFIFRKDLRDQIVVPYIAHQKPRIDPHVSSSVPIADKLDEVLFDGLFNVSAGPSGVVFEDGLGEFVGVEGTVVAVRLKPGRKWHSSFAVTNEKKKIAITQQQEVFFTAEDLRFTLGRIRKLGSLSPDYILVAQAFPDFDFTGPDDEGVIRFAFRPDRIWNEADIKGVLSFKIIPASAGVDSPQYTIGSGPYLYTGEYEDRIGFRKMPGGIANVTDLILKPFIDNSTYTTELRNRNINVLLATPFGSVSPILGDSSAFFHKSSIATSFFALYFNTERLSLDQRTALRKFINNRMLMERFFKVNTPQQRHIANYRGEGDNYDEYLNHSVFPTSTYYIEDSVVTPVMEQTEGDLSLLPDTIRIQTCLKYENREELAELVQILNDPVVFHGQIKASAVTNEEIALGNYDAVLVPVTGYRSNFLYDLYNVYLREPDFSAARISLQTTTDAAGKQTVDPVSFKAERNFFRLDLGRESPERDDVRQLLEYVYGFMSTHEIGDKQEYARMVDRLDQKLALGAWLFSLPSLAYLSRQFDESSIDMYGEASQLSTMKKWREKRKASSR
ncbi:MAG: hypothetical protein MUF22_02705 [Chitinispirillaceae bacterium]|jgi:hypothetical protein|nr:hypothetical protein [Chitinispirillaceae bacterium]